MNGDDAHDDAIDAGVWFGRILPAEGVNHLGNLELRWQESLTFEDWLAWQNAERTRRRRGTPYRDTPTVREVWLDDLERLLDRRERLEAERQWFETQQAIGRAEAAAEREAERLEAERRAPEVNEANRAPLEEAIGTDERYDEVVSRIRRTFGDEKRKTYAIQYEHEELDEHGKIEIRWEYGETRKGTVANDSRKVGLHRAYVKALTMRKTIDERGAVGFLITVGGREAIDDARETGQILKRRKRKRRMAAREDGRRRAPKSIDLEFVAALERPAAAEAGKAAAGSLEMWDLTREVHRDGLALKSRARTLGFTEGTARRKVKAAREATKAAARRLAT